MSYYLVQFVEDNIYHVCSRTFVKFNTMEEGLVTAKYKGSFYPAVIVSEGGKIPRLVSEQKLLIMYTECPKIIETPRKTHANKHV